MSPWPASGRQYAEALDSGQVGFDIARHNLRMNAAPDSAHHSKSKAERWAWWLLAWTSLLLGIIGIVLPVMPTAPFILLAAYASARGSKRMHAYLHGHRYFGPMIQQWEQYGAVSRRAKWLATVMMSLASVSVWIFAPFWWLALLVCLVMASVAIWLWYRPEPRLDDAHDTA